MSYEEIRLSAAENYSLSVLVFESPEAKASVQIIHGMEEYKERYLPFAEFLQKNGFNVILPDLRGHGKDAPLLSHIADENGADLLIRDQRAITEYIQKRFHALPIDLIGHSMGSIIARVLLQTDSASYAKTVLSGYVCPNPLSGIAVTLGKVVRGLKKPKGHSALLTNLALGPYSKAVPNHETALDWLSYNKENVRRYIADPLCGVEFTVGSYNALFTLLHRMGSDRPIPNLNARMPILLLAGEDDPCTGGEKGRAASKALLEKNGFRAISARTYQGMRHEILNEKDREKVYQDVLEFYRL